MIKSDKADQLPMETDVMQVSQLMLLTGWSKGHIYKLTSDSKIPYYKPFGKCIFFSKSEIEAILLSNRQATASEIKSDAINYVHQKMEA